MDPSKLNWSGNTVSFEVEFDDDGTPTSIQSGQERQNCASSQDAQRILGGLLTQAGEHYKEQQS